MTDILNVGFTGTRFGMTDAQKTVVRALTAGLLVGTCGLVAHHGDCVGADANFHAIAKERGASVHGHPPVDETHRAFCPFDYAYPPLTHMARNRKIVEASEIMIATPREETEQEYGGTWKTVRMARKLKRPLALVLPDGRVELERWPS